MANTPKLVFVGYTNIDINITPMGITTLPGGGAYFAAIAASLFTQPIGLVTRIGRDFESTFLLSRVLAEGVTIVPDKPNGRSTQTYHSPDDPTDRMIDIEMGVNPDLKPADFPLTWLQSVEIVHVATMSPLQQAAFITFLRAQAPQVKISLDTDYCFFDDSDMLAQLKKNFAQVDIAFVNRREYVVLRDVVDTLPEAIVKYDKDGAVYLRKGRKISQVAAEPVVVQDATGAGDVLAGMYLAHMVMGQTAQMALGRGVAIATEAVQEVGVSHLFHVA